MHLERCHQSEPESCRKNEQCGRHYPARPNSMLWNHKRRLRGLICRGTRCFWSHCQPPFTPGRPDPAVDWSCSHTISEGRSIPGAKRLGLRLVGSTHERTANDPMGHILVRDKRAWHNYWC